VNRIDVTAREAEAWAAFRGAIDAVPPEHREDPALHDGWSVKDVLWHVARWWADLPPAIEAIRTGEPAAGDDLDTDIENARVLAEGREHSMAEVEAATARTREEMLAAWTSAPDDERATEIFIAETSEHYEEHLPTLESFARSLA
jgi:hypothetical protein